MRDIIVMAGLLLSLPFCVLRPHLGVLVWIIVSLLNPHRMTYGMMYSFPVAQAVGGATIVGFIFGRKSPFPWRLESGTILVLFLYFTLTTLVALEPTLAWREWNRLGKTLIIIAISLMVFQDRARLRLLILTIAVSIALFGLKGALFAFRTGGQFMVFGPPGSFIEDNNALALAELMVLPLLLLLAQSEPHRWVKRSLFALSGLTVVAVVFSYSRGALVALIGLGAAALFLSRQRLRWMFLAIVMIVILYPMIPEKWHERMGTIATYEEDRSAAGRINAWHFAFNLAADRPLTGGGFNTFRDEHFLKYAPNPMDVHDAHSIYFEVLGEHGFLALGLFLLLIFGSIASLQGLKARVRRRKDMEWAFTYASMIQLAIVAYSIGGAFLGLAYFDLVYYLLAASVCLKVVVRRLEVQSMQAMADPLEEEEESPAHDAPIPVRPALS